MATKKKMLQAAAGNAGGEALDITDVFSTYLYTGNGSARSITNGIDLDGEGGLVWIKTRETAAYYNHMLYDTENGANNFLRTNGTNALTTASGFGLTSFNSDGFDMGIAYGNESGIDTASWTFRKAPKFFDVVTYTGDGTNNRQIAHNLSVVPGSIVVKRTDSTSSWPTWHRSSVFENLRLNTTAAASGGGLYVYGSSDTTFQVNNTNGGADTSSFCNVNGATYVAYLFAHNDGDGEFGPDGDQDIIKCGSYTGNGSTTGPEIDLGWEPQWVLVKGSDLVQDWTLIDTMRGMTDVNSARLNPNNSQAEASGSTFAMQPNPTGFTLKTNGFALNGNGNTYIYIAIRRGPLAQPESGTEVFKPVFGDGTPPAMESGFVVDAAIVRNPTAAADNHFVSRMTGTANLITNSTAAEGTFLSSQLGWDYNTGFMKTYGSTVWSAMFRRAPNFFDVVAYTGDGVAGRTVSHNLGVAPEMMWVKPRSAANPWQVYHSATGNTKALNFDTGTGYTSINYWNNTTPSSSDFTLGSSVGFNGSGVTYIAYLFATLAGVSKVGSYTGNGTSQTIDCGFTSGARFILVKRTDSTGDWYVWDTERGIVAGNDPHLSLNTTAAEVTSDDSIDPDNSGFIVNQVGATNINVSSASYIFYAVA